MRATHLQDPDPDITGQCRYSVLAIEWRPHQQRLMPETQLTRARPKMHVHRPPRTHSGDVIRPVDIVMVSSLASGGADRTPTAHHKACLILVYSYTPRSLGQNVYYCRPSRRLRPISTLGPQVVWSLYTNWPGSCNSAAMIVDRAD